MLRMSGCERPWSARPRFPSLNDNGWLTLTPVDFRQAVFERLTMRKFSAGEAVYRTGDTEGGLWAIVEGGVQLEIPGLQLTPGLAYVTAPGFWFGETLLITKSAREVDAYAAQPSIFATVSLADCRAILDEDPSRWQWISLLANMNCRLALSLAADLLLPEPQQRIVAADLRLGNQSQSHPQSRPPPPQPAPAWPDLQSVPDGSQRHPARSRAPGSDQYRLSLAGSTRRRRPQGYARRALRRALGALIRSARSDGAARRE
jgi:CRP-like cAMP-binding protein